VKRAIYTPRTRKTGKDRFIKRRFAVIISSPAFGNGEQLPKRYGYRQENVNPPLEISGVPLEAGSLALIVDDPDAPIPSPPFVHWTLWNMDPRTTNVDEGETPPGAVEGTTSWGKTGYNGPSPPGGTHRYFFKLFALDVALYLPPGAGVGELYEKMEGHVVEKAEVIGLYSAPGE
jgi:Raf kinase inhibitor-like YbhB/YbcL family protein